MAKPSGSAFTWTTRGHLALWSKEFAGPAKDSEALQADVAAHVTDVTSWLISNRWGIASAGIDTATLVAALKAADEMQNGAGDGYLPIFQRLAARAPHWAQSHSGLAVALTSRVPVEPAEDQAPMVAESRREARRALDLDPQDGEAYWVLAVDTPGAAWGEREALILKEVSVDPNGPYPPALYADFLGQVGRNREALAMERRSAVIEPYWARPGVWLAIRLADTGEDDQARVAMARARRLWPNDPTQNVFRVYAAVTGKPALRALGLIGGPNPAPYYWQPEAMAVWRRFVLARDAHDPATRAGAARAVKVAADAGAFRRADAAIALSMLGDIDGALANADRVFTAEGLRQPTLMGQADTKFLFSPATASMRRDPRFMRLAGRLGLVDYWRAGGRWPDFCAEPGLPYDSKAEALRIGRLGAIVPTSGSA